MAACASRARSGPGPAGRQTASVDPASPPKPEPPTDPSPGSEPDPVLPPGREVPWSDMVGCLVAYLLIAIEIIGLPLGIVVGLLAGEWRWLVPWTIVAIVVFVAGRLNRIPIID